MNKTHDMPHVIITGTTSGLGLCMCRSYLQQGYFVTGFARSPAPAEFQNFVTDKQYTHVSADLSEPESLHLVISEFLRKRTSIVIINAADYAVSTDGDETHFSKQISLNLLFPILLIQHLQSLKMDHVPKMVFISSIMAYICDGKNPAYGAAKSAVSHFIDSTMIQSRSSISFLKVIAGPMQDGNSAGSFAKKITSISYSEAADRILRFINSGKEEIFIPRIWKYIIGSMKVLGKKRVSMIINKRR